MPPRLRVARISTQAPGSAKSANQAIPFGMCLLEWWPISCASTTRTSASENVPSIIVLQSTTRRDGPKPTAYAFAWLVVPLTSSTSDRDARDALLLLELLRRALQRGILERRRLAEVRLREREGRLRSRRRRTRPGSTRSRRASARGTSRRGARCRARRTRRRARTSGRAPTRGSPPRSGRTAVPTRRRAA